MAKREQPKPTCGSCSYADKTPDALLCRRFPPQVIYAPVNPERPFVTIYPNVRPEMAACGEYQKA